MYPHSLPPPQGKIVCPDLDSRCIDPQEYCCDPDTDPKCKFLYPCCEALLEFSLGNRLSAQYAKQQVGSRKYGLILYRPNGVLFCLINSYSPFPGARKP